jgi:hypothetical protein
MLRLFALFSTQGQEISSAFFANHTCPVIPLSTCLQPLDGSLIQKKESPMHSRISERFEINLPVWVSAQGFSYRCQTLNLSPYGVAVDRQAELLRHEDIPVYWLRFHLLGHYLVTLAQPTWSQGRHQGYRFLELSSCDRILLAETIDSALTDQSNSLKSVNLVRFLSHW